MGFFFAKPVLARVVVLAASLASFSAFAGEIVTDTDIRIEGHRAYPDDAWQHWIYSPHRQDYSDSFPPAGFLSVGRNMFRKFKSKEEREMVVTIVLLGAGEGRGVRAFPAKLDVRQLGMFFRSISSLAGAFVDGNQIYLAGRKRQNQEAPALHEEDVVVAFRAVANSEGRGAAVNIDIRRDNETGNDIGIVEYDGFIENSHLGQVLFEADRVLKTVSLDCDNIAQKPLGLKYWWHRSKFDFKKQPKKNTIEEWHQFWFLGEGLEISADPQTLALRFDNDVLAVKALKINKGFYKGGLHFETSSRSETGRFGENFNQNFPSYARQFPVIRELVEEAKLVALARWLFDNGIILKFEQNDVKMFYNRFTPARTPIIKVKKTRKVQQIDMRDYDVTEFELNSKGGVDLRKFTFKKKALGNWVKSLSEDPQYVVFRLF